MDNIQLEYDEYYANKRQRWEQNKLKNKIAVYDELLQNISSENIFNLIDKNKSKNYVILHKVSFVVMPCFVTKRKKLFYNFDPFGKGTIYNLLSKSLPENYTIHVYEPFYVDEYIFVLYISWNKLRVKNYIKIRSSLREKLMPCDVDAYVRMQEDLVNQEILEKKMRRSKVNKLSKDTRI